MLGKLLSEAVKLVITGGDGSAESKRQSDVMLGQDIVDGICKAVESIDD